MSEPEIRRILMPLSGALGARLAGPEIRPLELAKALSRDYDVTLAPSNGTDGERDGVRTVAGSRARLLRESANHDAVLAGSIPPYLLACKYRNGFVAISDQHDPHDLEIATKPQSARQRDRDLSIYAAVQALQLRYADIVLCPGERQRARLLQR